MFYFIHVQGQNALTTLLHLADELLLLHWTNITPFSHFFFQKTWDLKTITSVGIGNSHMLIRTFYLLVELSLEEI